MEDLRSGDPKCPICGGMGWVCEDHPYRVWEHDGCGGAGAHCDCNPDGRINWVALIAALEDEGDPS